MRFNDRVCVVTGGGSGVGRATVSLLAAEGAHVVLIDVDAERGRHVTEELSDYDVWFLEADLGDSRCAQRAAELAASRWGRVDVLVNNAAVMTFDPAADLAVDAWERVLSVDLTAPFVMARSCLPRMPSGGSIVNVSSVHAHRTTANVAAYAAAKGGLEALTRALSVEWSERGIRVNAVAPGGVNTPLLWSNPQVQEAGGVFDTAPAQPEQLAAVIAFLASDAAHAITGSVLVADGGQLAKL